MAEPGRRRATPSSTGESWRPVWKLWTSRIRRRSEGPEGGRRQPATVSSTPTPTGEGRWSPHVRGIRKRFGFDLTRHFLRDLKARWLASRGFSEQETSSLIRAHQTDLVEEPPIRKRERCTDRHQLPPVGVDVAPARHCFLARRVEDVLDARFPSTRFVTRWMCRFRRRCSPANAPAIEFTCSRAHSRFPGHALTPTGVMAIRCKQFHLPDL